MKPKATKEGGAWLMITEEIPKEVPEDTETPAPTTKEGLSDFFDSYGFYPDSGI